jgi:hypothetical protein
MGKNPSFPFYPSDWTRDLDDQDLEVEGAWIRICCRLWWTHPRGVATKNLKEWSKILRTHPNKTKTILTTLLKNGICDGGSSEKPPPSIFEIPPQNPPTENINFFSDLDNQNITIINRRMKRYDEICKIRQEVGKKGGNPILKKTEKNLDNQNINQKSLPSSSSSSSINNTNIADKTEKIDGGNGSKPKIPYLKIFNLYKTILPELPQISSYTKERKNLIKSAWNDSEIISPGGISPNSVDFYEKYFKYIKQSNFLIGKGRPHPETGKIFIADFDWIFKKKKMVKILEGNYHR